MRFLYVNGCFGVTINRLVGALIHCGASRNGIKKEIKKLGLPRQVRIGISIRKYKNGMLAKISSNDNCRKRKWVGIKKIIERSAVDGSIKKKIMRTYSLIARAEAKIHGTTINRVHFHEIGAWHNLARITAVFTALKNLHVQNVCCSPLNTGSGFVKTSHGILQVPAPATREILKNAQVYGSAIRQELVTPSAAAIVKSIASEFRQGCLKKGKYYYGYEPAMRFPVRLKIFQGKDSAVSLEKSVIFR